MSETPDTGTYDVIVIGGGAVGENAAARTAAAGLHTAMVEADLVGGECSYWACMPSKALLRPGEALSAARHVDGAAAAATGYLDVAAVLHRRDGFTSHWDDAGQVEWAESADVEVVRGRARLAGERLVEVAGGSSTRRLSAAQAVVVATGSVPHEPAVDGLADVQHWGSREATAVTGVPASLVIVGGGPVGVEMADAMTSLGSEVTLVARSGLIHQAEPFAGELVGEALRDRGVRVLTGRGAERVERDAGGPRITLDDGSTLTADELLIAGGRRPATDDVGLDTVGLEPGEPLEIDDRGRVRGVPGEWLYAVGDVTGRAPLTHQGKYQARIVGSVIGATAQGDLPPDPPAYGASTLTADHTAVPQVVFSNPQVAWVGTTAAQAQEDGQEVDVVDLDIDVAGASLHRDGYTGKARFVVDRRRRVLVGVTFAGPDVAELLHAATIAVVGEVPLDRLWHAVPSFPTMSEVWLRFLEKYGL